ncbi:MAG: surfeit locus 1 family protein [Halioglobus sp.]|jgi:cytochrome oxidase assembly protein ShyY1
MPNNSNLKFFPEWRISLATAALFPFLIWLGFWQLDRAQEKSEIGKAWELRSLQPPTPLAQLVGQESQALPFSRVLLTGKFVENVVFLLDNKTRNGKFGYEVLSLFDLEGVDQFVVVNRGWIAGDSARLSLPEIPHVQGLLSVSGHLYIPGDKPYLLEEQTFESGWPKRIQALEMDKISKVARVQVGGPVFPYLVRTDIAQPGALAVDWKIVNVSPQKHNAYAFQWFAMALFLGVFYVLRSTNLWQVLSIKRRN